MKCSKPLGALSPELIPIHRSFFVRTLRFKRWRALALAFAAGILGMTAASPDAASEEGGATKWSLKGNRTVDYKVDPGSADSFEQWFSEGVFYGRFRSNTFYWNWDEDVPKDNYAWGVGGSVIYRSA